MKKFKLQRITYKNLMSVGASPVDIQLDAFNYNIISGQNGHGKSTLIEAITFALFGKPFRDIKKGQLINTFNKKELVVELWFEYNSHAFHVKRGQKPNIFEITKDGVLLDEASSAKDFQEEFENMIGINYNSYKQVVVLGTAGYTPFMGLSTPNRRKLVEDLLEVSILADMDKINKAEIREINQNVAIINEKIDSINNQLKIYKDNQEKQNKLSGDQVQRLEDMKAELVKEAKSLKKKYEELAEELQNSNIPESNGKKQHSLMSMILNLESSIKEYKKVLHNHASGGECPTCKQEMGSNIHITSEIEKLLVEHEKTLEIKRKELSILEEEAKETERLIERERKVKSEMMAMKPVIVDKVDKAKKVQLAIDKCKEEKIDYSSQIEELEKARDKSAAEKTELLLEKYNRSAITELLKDSGIKGSIVNEYIPVFNKEINKYLKIMDADYVFTLDKEFNETIKSRGRESFSYNSFSQGEKARIDLALLFTWRDIAERISGIKLSCLILDEVTDGSTDDAGVKAIQSILKSMKDTNIYVISHRGHNPDDYDRHIIMNKVGRFSEMKSNV